MELNKDKIETKNVYLKNQNTTNWNNYKYQQNCYTYLLRKITYNYVRNPNVKNLNDNKKFWKKIKSFFTNKGLASNNIVLKEKGNLITHNQKLANTYFINITDTLQLKSPLKLHSQKLFFYENHDSIFRIKKISFQKNFISKRYHLMIPLYNLRLLFNDIYLLLLTDIINDSLKRGMFPDKFNLAEVIPLFKEADLFDTTNYHPVSLFSPISKVFERLIYKSN